MKKRYMKRITFACGLGGLDSTEGGVGKWNQIYKQKRKAGKNPVCFSQKSRSVSLNGKNVAVIELAAAHMALAFLPFSPTAAQQAYALKKSFTVPPRLT